MKLQFAGVGGAFAGSDQYQTNAVVTGESGKKMLIDCGGDARFSLKNIVGLHEIDAVYITHLHADHIGGLEWLAFCTFFNPTLPRPKLFMVGSLMRELWNRSLRGGLDSIEGKVMNLTDYFDCRAVAPNQSFLWDGIKFSPLQTVHVMAGMKIMHSYGLMIDVDCPSRLDPWYRVFYTGDTQFCPHQIMEFYNRADVIFQDCERGKIKSGVHAYMDDLFSLDKRILKKMWFMHYKSSIGGEPTLECLAAKGGVAGFVLKGQEFEFPLKCVEAPEEVSVASSVGDMP